MTINEAVRQYLQHLEIDKGYARGTIDHNQRLLEVFTTWAARQGVKEITDVDLDLITRYRKHLAARRKAIGSNPPYSDDVRGRVPIKKVTQGYYLIALRGMLRYLLVHRDMNVLSPDKIGLPKTERPMVSFLTLEQVYKMMDMPVTKLPGHSVCKRNTGLRDRAIMEMLFSTGLRVSELVSLNRDQIDLEGRELGIIGKGSKPRVVFLSNRAAKWLRRYLKRRTDQFKPLFINYHESYVGRHPRQGSGERLLTRTVQKFVKAYAEQANLPGHITPHTFRHTFATDLLRNGADIRSVQEMLGHSSITTTMGYTHVTDERLRQIHEKYHRKQTGRRKGQNEPYWPAVSGIIPDEPERGAVIGPLLL